MKILVITAFWRRFELLEIMLDNLAGLGIEVVAAGSEGAVSREIAQEHGAHYTEVDNQPLGQKWQHALFTARDYDPEAVMVLGSDNIVNQAIIDEWSRLLDEGYEYLGLYDAYQFNPEFWTLIHWPGYVGKREGEPIGSARCFSRAFLDRIKWRLWDTTLSSSLDWSATQRINQFPCKCHFVQQKSTDLKHLGIKHKQTMSASLHTRPDVESFTPLLIADWYGEIGKRILKC